MSSVFYWKFERLFIFLNLLPEFPYKSFMLMAIWGLRSMTPHWAWAACGHTPFASFPIQILTVSSLCTVITTPKLRYYRSIDSYGWAGIIVELGLVPNVPKRFQKLKPFYLPGTLDCHKLDKVSGRLRTLYFVLIVVSNRLYHSLLPKSG